MAAGLLMQDHTGTCGTPSRLETTMKILVCNAGSSSLKFSLFEAEGELLLAEGGIDWSTTPTQLDVHCTGQPETHEELTLRHHADAIARILDALQAGPAAPLQAPGEVHAVGHRVVHGGERYTEAPLPRWAMIRRTSWRPSMSAARLAQ